MAKKKAKAKKPANPTPRQKSLPGMQDRKIAILEKAALRYADVRDERMDWTRKEVDAKQRVQELMHELGRAHYGHGNIEIDLVPEGEKVRVRVHDREPAEEVPDSQYPDPGVDKPEEPEPEPDDENDQTALQS